MDGKLTFSGGQLVFNAFRGFKIPLRAIESAQVESAGEIDRRVTVTRVVGLGLAAWALKKREDTTANYLTITYERRGKMVTVIFEADKLPPFSKRHLPGQPKSRAEARRFVAEIKTRAAKARSRSTVGTELAQGASNALDASARALGSGSTIARAANDRRSCPHCGKQIKKAAKVCRYCDRTVAPGMAT